MCETVYLSRRSERELFAAAELHAGELVRCAIRSADVQSPSMPVRRLRPHNGISDDPAQPRKPDVGYDIDGTVRPRSELLDVPDLRLAPVVDQTAQRAHSPLPQSRERSKAPNAPISWEKSGPSKPCVRSPASARHQSLQSCRRHHLRSYARADSSVATSAPIAGRKRSSFAIASP